jgi:hypothetical protein
MLYFAFLSSAMVTTAESLKYCSGDSKLANKQKTTLVCSSFLARIELGDISITGQVM